jgi:hypothetical protein
VAVLTSKTSQHRHSRVFVVKDGKPQGVMSFEDIKTAFWERDPATNFGCAFRKLG